MKNKPEIDIYRSLKRNNLIVWALVFLFFFVVVVNGVVLFRIYNITMNHVLTLDKNGQVLPLSWVDRNENIHVEIKDDVDRFLHYFYEYDAYNYQERIEKHALWLGDKSVEDLYIMRKKKMWYDKVRQFQITQKILLNPEDIQVVGNKEPYAFRAKATLVIEQDGQRNIYQFVTTGNVIRVGRNYPLNPHGLLITNFLEKNRTKVADK